MIEGLSEALSRSGFSFRVELRDRLVLLTDGPGPGRSATLTLGDRERILSIVREHGYTHVAIELTAEERATLPGRHS
jgi:hypothetical protein